MTQTGKWWFSWRLVVAVLGAGVMLLLGAMAVADLYWLRHRGEVVTATVVEEHASYRSDWIKVNYVTRDGQPVTAKTSHYYSAEVDRPIEIRYDPKKPHRMQGASYSLSYTFPILVYGGFGTLAVLFTLVDLRFNLVNRLRGLAGTGGGTRTSQSA